MKEKEKEEEQQEEGEGEGEEEGEEERKMVVYFFPYFHEKIVTTISFTTRLSPSLCSQDYLDPRLSDRV